MVIAFDTNIFVYYFEQNRRFGQAARRAISLLTKDKVRGVTSVISLIELLSLPQSKAAVANLKDLYSQIARLTTVDVNEDIGLGAARIRREYRYRTPDAIQLATALIFKADIFFTNDRRLKSFKEVKIRLISKP